MDTLFQQLTTTGADRYLIRQLVFVNSAAYAYTEIRVDQHTALFGRNNLGKTSMLNALKLFLLPEDNFRKCQSKFGFCSRSGDFYSAQESFNYYFPAQNSFILLEAENLYGPFCILLHQGSREFSYARMLVPCDYDQIRHLFWDVAADCNQGLGAPLEELSIASIQQAFQSLGGEALHDRRTIRERLFSPHPLSREEGRYCLLPLKQGGTERELAAWKQLIHLAFDIGANDSRTLPDALATIIEGEKQRKADELSVDLDQILQEYQALRQERDELQRISNAREDWDRFDNGFHRYLIRSREVGQFHVDLKAAVTLEVSRIEPQIEAAIRSHEAAREACRQASVEASEASDRLKRLEGKLDACKQQLNRHEQAVKRIHEILRAYPEQEPEGVLAELNRQATHKAELIQALENEKERQKRMEQLNQQLIQARHSRERLSHQLEHNSPSVLDQLDRQSATVLANLAPALARSTVNLEPQAREVMQRFAGLFEVADESLLLCGEPLPELKVLPYNPEAIRQQQEQRLADLKREITEQESELNELRASCSLSRQALSDKLDELNRELGALRSAITLLQAKETHVQQLQDAQASLAELEQQLEQARQDEKRCKAHYSETEEQEQKARRRRDGLQEQKLELSKKQERLEGLESSHGVLRGWASRLEPEKRALSDDALETLKQQCQALEALREEVMEALRRLLQLQLLEGDGSDAYLVSFDMQKIKALHQAHKRLFDTLEGKLVDYDHRVLAHNKATSIRMDTLREAGKQIHGFIAEINREFGAYSVSNLAEVQLACDLHPRFQLLLDDLARINLHGEALHDERLYQRLNDFCDEFFREGNRHGRVLQMHQLIEKVRYRFRLAGQEHFTENAQSNGTTSMVNSLLLSILLKRLLAQDAQICLPLVMDEMASIDQQNLKTAVAVAEKHGFVLFGASPDMSAEIVQAVNHYIHLGMFMATEKAYSRERRVVHHGGCEALRALSDRAEAGTMAEVE